VHPYINQAIAAQRAAEFERAAEARRRVRAAKESARASRQPAARGASPVARRVSQQVGTAVVAGVAGSSRRNGTDLYPARLAASRAPGNASLSDREEDQAGAAALCQTRC
jgi:hypothetical protein